jgi:membrane associated rhomboid family serine protease
MHDVPARLLPSTIPGILIASVVIVTLLGWLIKPIQRAFILSPYRVRENWEIYRLFTAGWLHTDLMHLVFNMLSLYFFVDPALGKLGVTPFLALYISAVIVAFIPTTLRYMGKPNYYSLGASGAVTAVMFSAILLNPKLKLYVMFIPYPVPAIWYAIGYLAYSVWQSYSADDGINHDAHLSGAFYGALFTYAFKPEAVESTLKSLW